MKRVLAQLNLIAEARGNEKKEVAKTFFPDDTEVARVVKLALDPMVTFNVGKKVLAEFESREAGTEHLSVMVAENFLERMANRELTGNTLKSTLSEIRDRYCEASWEMLRRVLLKDLRIGAGEKLFNDIQEKFIKVFAVNLAHKYESKRVKSLPVAVEIKHDGVRVVTVIDLARESVRFFSRTGKEFTSFNHLIKPALDLGYTAMGLKSNAVIVMDGEVVSGSFNKTVSEVRRKDAEATDAILIVFEVLSGDEFFSGCTKPLSRRRRRAEAFFAKAKDTTIDQIRLIEQQLAHSLEEIDEMYEDARYEGHEGIIVKPLDGVYQNKRTYGYMKVKAEESEDLIITDIYQGEYDTKYKDMAGGVIVKRDNNVEVRVGGGWTDEQRAQIWADFKQIPVAYQTTEPDEETGRLKIVEKIAEPRPGNVIGRIIEVLYHEETPDGSLRHPRFARFRDALTGDKE